MWSSLKHGVWQGKYLYKYVTETKQKVKTEPSSLCCKPVEMNIEYLFIVLGQAGYILPSPPSTLYIFISGEDREGEQWAWGEGKENARETSQINPDPGHITLQDPE